MLKSLLQGVVFMATASTLQAAPIDLIIDTDPGADDVVALFLAMASPNELNIRAITTVAGNVRLDKTSRNAAWPANGRGVKTSRCTPVPAAHWCARRSTPPTFMAKKASPVYRCTSRKRLWPRAMPCNTWSIPSAQPNRTASLSPCSARRPTWPWR